MARLTAALALILVLVGACATAAAIPYPGPSAPTAPTARGATTTQPAVTFAPVPWDFQPIGIDTAPHSGFPTTARQADGQVRMVWRDSTGHLDRDGRVMTSVGDPTTGVWTPPTEIILDTSVPGRDMRPGALSTVDGVLWLTYFWWQDGALSGAMAASSTDNGVTWGNSVRIDIHPWAAISSPIVKANGKLWTAYYTNAVANTTDPESAYAAWSTDGVTWTSARIAVGATGNEFQEPWVLAGSNNTTVFVLRDGSWKSLASRSVDTAGTWSALNRNVIPNATGNSASVRATNGKIYLVYRHTVTRDAMLAVSTTNGVTWTPNPTPLLRAPSNLGTGSVGMTYAAPIDLGDGMVWCPIGMERHLDASRLYGGWL